jgi:putative endonuclease
MARHNEIGKIGEDIAVKWLIREHFTILERNYLKKFGEIDIVARETDFIHFVEVKTVSYETIEELEYAVSHETWRPEENVHDYKVKRLKRVIEAWLFERKYKGAFQIDIVTVRLVTDQKYARVKMIENVIFE